MSVTTHPPVPRRAFSQRVILDVLAEHDGQFVPLHELVSRVYGDATARSQLAFRAALCRLRAQCPGLEIESALCYRLRSGRTV